MKLRAFRTTDVLWAAVMKAAKRQGVGVAEYCRRALQNEVDWDRAFSVKPSKRRK